LASPSTRLRIPRDAADAFLHFAAEIAGGAFYAVFIHGRFLHLVVKPPQSTMVPLLCDRWETPPRTNPAGGAAGRH
jgi:hypothetical protein